MTKVMSQAADERHRYGQHYTPEAVARLLAALAVRSAGDLVLDPSCGDGRLLEQALRIKQFLDLENGARRCNSEATAGGAAPESWPDQLFGLDRSAEAIELAARSEARVFQADFFDVEPGTKLTAAINLPATFDSIVGNPPYIRQELMGSVQKINIYDRLMRGTKQPRKRNSGRATGADPNGPDKLGTPYLFPVDLEDPELFIPKWSGRSDIYVYFFAHAARFLKPGGRLVFITASSWLDVGYGTPLQEFLLRNFRIVAILESAVESFFENASVNTTITVLERESRAGCRDTNTVRFVQLCAPLVDILGNGVHAESAVPKSPEVKAREFAKWIEDARQGDGGESLRVRTVEQGALLKPTAASQPAASASPYIGSKWGKYLRADDVFFQIIERGAGLRPLSQMADVRFGVKTGANDFFYLKQHDPTAGNESSSEVFEMRRLDELASVRRGMTTGANEFFYLRLVSTASDESPAPTMMEDGAGRRHMLEPAYLAPVIFSLKEISGILLDGWKPSRFFFRCSGSKLDLQDTAALNYIQQGERDGYNLRPTCASREPWYALARDLKPAPLIFPSKVGERWIVAINKAGVYEDKKLYGIMPRGDVSIELLAALMNSTWARYYSEMTCRQMTGAQAIADIDVAVAERILLPDPTMISDELQRRLLSALGCLAARPIGSLFKEVELQDRRHLDELVLTAIGFDDEGERGEVLNRLYHAVSRLVRARISRSTAKSGAHRGEPGPRNGGAAPETYRR
jgi:methylase of polypeptide subunit release factors